MATTTPPRDDSRLPPKAWYILGAVCLLPITITLLYYVISAAYNSASEWWSRKDSPSSELVRLTADEYKATQEALMKLPLAERKVLWVLFQCDPENESFRPDKKGELGATKTYRSKGAEAFGKTCVDMLVRARLIFTLAVVDATPSGSKLVSLPEMFGYETTATGPDGETGYAMEAVTREDGQISALRLTAKGTKNVRVTLTCHPATKRADSP